MAGDGRDNGHEVGLCFIGLADVADERRNGVDVPCVTPITTFKPYRMSAG
jgi:hypothetical protein